MKKLISRVVTMIMVLCLIGFQVQPANAATAVTTVPSVSEVETEAKTTADYLLHATDFTSLNTSSKFYNASRVLVLAMRSGTDASAQVNSYLATVGTLLNSDGSLNITVSGNSPDIAASYAALIMVLTLNHQNPADFNHVNVLHYFDTLLHTYQLSDYQFTSDPVTYASTGMNPYMIGMVYRTVLAYEDKMSDMTSVKSLIRQAIVNMSTEDGCNYYGYSTDNNGMVYPLVKPMEIHDTTMTALFTRIYEKEASNLDRTDGISANYGTKNSDSTACALALYSSFGQSTEAALSYHALVDNFKIASTPGAYSAYTAGNGTGNITLSTTDSLYGLVTYLSVLKNTVNPFDVTDVLTESVKPSPKPDNTQPSTEPGTDTKPNTDSATLPTADPTQSSTDTNGANTTSASDSSDTADATSENGNSVATGDYSMTGIYLLSVVLSGACILGLTVRKRRFNCQK